MFVHLTLVPYIPSAGELKTKPTQHSVKELQNVGIQPQMLICRCDRPIPENERRKIASFCNVRAEAVIPALDVNTIYAVPISYHEAGMDREVLRHFALPFETKPDLSRWQRIVDTVRAPEGEVRIAVVGKYTNLLDSYKSLAEALTHGGIANKVKVQLEWVDSEVFEKADSVQQLDGVHGILVPGGFGERGTAGKIEAVRFARERKVPFLGICFGMQMAVIEAARNLAGMAGASSTEFGPCDLPVVGLLTEWARGNDIERRRAGGDLGGTMRARRLPGGFGRGFAGPRRLWQRCPDFRAPPAPLRGEHPLPRAAGGHRPALLRPLAGRRAAGNRGIPGSPLVHRRAIPPRAEIQALRAAPAVRRLYRRRRRAVEARMSEVRVGNLTIGNDLPFTLIAGPCQIESLDHTMEVASALSELSKKLGIGVIYKSSYDKANRTSANAARGIGMAQGLEILARVRETFGMPVLTDVHDAAQCAPVAEAVDVLQIPAFLCRQTDLLLAAGNTGQGDQRQKRPVPRPLGYEERRCQNRQHGQ